MDDFDLDDVILYLLSHKGESFDDAAFAIFMFENKSRFVAIRHDLSKQRDIHRQERGETKISVKREFLENTNCFVMKFSHDARTRVDVICGCAANIDLIFQNISSVSKFHLVFIFDDRNTSIAKNLNFTNEIKIIYNEKEEKRLSNFDWSLINLSIANGKSSILNITDFIQFKIIVFHRDGTFSDYIDKVKKFRMSTTGMSKRWKMLWHMKTKFHQSGIFECFHRISKKNIQNFHHFVCIKSRWSVFI